MSHAAEKSSTDIESLTSLANRHGLEDYVRKFRASNDPASRLCLILVDLDYFKRINDLYGHRAGDQILADIGRMLQHFSLGAGIVARWGGEEFAIAMPGSLEQGREFAEFIRREIETHSFSANGEVPISVTCSAGVASAAADVSLDDLMREADQCLFTAKDKGRNCVVSTKEFQEFVDTAGEDALIADFENRIRVTADRMTRALVLKARRLAQQYRSEADHDALTSLFNRRHLDRLLPRLLEKYRREGRPLSIALLDLDHFGRVNKTYGFPTGDRALKTAASVIQQNVRALDWAARYGGEEICVVLPDTDLATATHIAERMRQALSLETIAAYDGGRFQITASIGVVEVTRADNDIVALFQRASDKVGEAKKNGRNQVRF
jgi:diguanylate cyclase (GGDEF)-like protein